MNDKTIEEKRNERRKLTGECFTPSYLVSEICDKLVKYSPESFTNTGLLFLDPSCGNGNILLQVLKRKLKYATPIQSISTIYGVDIMEDNIKECRLRLLKVLQENNVKITIEHIKILKRNITCAPLEKYPNGSLDYLDLDEKDTFNDKSKHLADKIRSLGWQASINLEDGIRNTYKEFAERYSFYAKQ